MNPYDRSKAPPTNRSAAAATNRNRDNYYAPGRGQGNQQQDPYYQDRQDQVGRRGQPRGRQAQQTRIFVALFDYDPPSMSPNPDACDEELPFREGQLIKVTPGSVANPPGFFFNPHVSLCVCLCPCL